MKIKLNHNILLTVCVLVLALLCVMSIAGPVGFGRQQAQRERVVKQYLAKIRLAEEQYRAATGSYTAHFDSLIQRGYLDNEIQWIPFSDGKRFELKVDSLQTKSGRQVSLMECSAPYAVFLHDLDPQQVNELIEKQNTSGLYPGLKIGDLTTPNDNAGNWE